MSKVWFNEIKETTLIILIERTISDLTCFKEVLSKKVYFTKINFKSAVQRCWFY